MAKYSKRRATAERENLGKPHITCEDSGHWNYIWCNGFCSEAKVFCFILNNAAPKRGFKRLTRNRSPANTGV